MKVTAAVEQQNPPPEKEERFDADTLIEMMTDTVMKHRIPASVGDKIISVAMTLPEKDPKKLLSKALQKTFTFAGPSKKPLVLVGPPGAGKTLMAAKLAARAVLGGTPA